MNLSLLTMASKFGLSDRRAGFAFSRLAMRTSVLGMTLLGLTLFIRGNAVAQGGGSYPDPVHEVTIQPGMPTTATGDPHRYRSPGDFTPAPNNPGDFSSPSYSAPPEQGYSTTSIEVQTDEDDEEGNAQRPVRVTRYLHGAPREEATVSASKNHPAASGSGQKRMSQPSASGGGYTIVSPPLQPHSAPVLTPGMSSDVLPYVLFPFAASIAFALRRLTRQKVVTVFVKVVVDNATKEIADIIVETAFGRQIPVSKVWDVYDTRKEVQQIQKEFDPGCLGGTLTTINVLGTLVSWMLGAIALWATAGLLGMLVGFILSVLVQFFVQIITDLTRLSLSYFAFRQ